MPRDIEKTFLRPARCGHCNKRLVVMDTHTGSVLPVEIPEGDLIYTEDTKYDSTKHISHLKNCEKLRAEWGKKKWKYIKRNNPLFAFLSSPLKERTR